MTEALARRPRRQVRIWWFMVATAAAAGLLALPSPALMALGFLGVVAVIPATLIGLGALVAPRGGRLVVAFWVAALTPLVLLAWLMVVRSCWITRPLHSRDSSMLLSWTLAIPYIDVQLAIVVILPALFLGAIGASGTRHGRGMERVCGVPVIWGLTWIVFSADPFVLSAWVRD